MRRLPCKQGAKRRSEQWKRPCDRCPQSKLIKRSCAETPNHLYRLVEHYTRPHEQQQLINISATNFLLGNQLHSVKQKRHALQAKCMPFNFYFIFTSAHLFSFVPQLWLTRLYPSNSTQSQSHYGTAS